jgi:hypothetical protein
VRDVLILDALRPILERWVAKMGETGLLFRPSTKQAGDLASRRPTSKSTP